MRSDVEKQIYLEPTWKIHVAYKQLMASPPEGYRFVSAEGAGDKLSLAVSRRQLAPWLLAQAYSLAPMTLLKAYLDRFLRRPPAGTVLTFSCGHLVFRPEPWVIELASVTDPIAAHPYYFRRLRGIAEKAFASRWCRKILCWSEYTRKTMTDFLDCSQFRDKIEVVPTAVPRAEVTAPLREDGKARLFFLGSANMVGEFEARGGREVVEAFAILRERYPNVELTIRSEVPPDVKSRIRALPDVRIIEETLPGDELARLFQSQDIFLFPGHYSAWLAILEAMSHALPVIATDVHSTAEYVIDGETGLLLKGRRPPNGRSNLPVTVFTNQLRKAQRTADPQVVADLVQKAALLIEDRELRQRLGRQARQEVERGRFSIERRNSVLQRILDEATQEEAPQG